MFVQLSHCLRTHPRSIAANHNILHPVLHCDGKLRSFIPLAIGGQRFSCIFKTIAVKAMMDGNPVERLNSFELRKFVNETGCKKDFRGCASRAVRADKLEFPAGRDDAGDPRPAHRDGFVAREFFQRLVQEIRRRLPFPSEEAVDRMRAPIALTAFVTD